MNPHERNLFIGIGYILAGWFFFTFFSTVAKLIFTEVSFPMLVFVVSSVGLLFQIPWLMKHGLSSLKTNRPGLIFVRGFVGMLGTVSMYLAVGETSLVNAMLLANTAPFFVPFVAWIWRKKPIQHKLWPAICIGFLGTLLILKPGFEKINAGAFYALGNAVAVSITMIAMRRLSKTERNHTVVFYYFLIGWTGSIPLLYWHWTPVSREIWGILIFLGILASLAQLTFHRSFHYARPHHLSPFSYSGVVYSTFFQWLIWKTWPDELAWVGIFLVTAGGILAILGGSKTQPVN